MPEEELQWRVWIVPSFNQGTESLLIMKSHHVIGDGLGLFIAWSTLQESYSPDQFH